VWLKNILAKNSFAKNVLLISGGTVIAQLVNMLFSPVVTRLYTPEDFGVLSVYSSVLGLVAIVSSLKYELAIPIADNDETAVNIFLLCLIILVGFVLCITVILVFASAWIIKTFNVKNLSDFKFYIPFGVFFIGTYTIFTRWALRKRDYKSISKTKYFQTTAQNIVKIGFGLFHFGYAGLLLGTIAGESTGITTLCASFLKKDRHLLKHLNLSRIKYSARRYVNFPLFSVVSHIFNASGTNLTPLLISYLYGNQMAGYYGLAHTVINLPMMVIGNAVNDVFYGEAVNLAKKDLPQLRRLVLKLAWQLGLFSLIPLVVLFFGGPFLFSIVFGEAWRESGVYARILVIFILFRLIHVPVDRIFSIFEKQKMSLFIDIVRAIFILIVFLLSKCLQLNPHIFLGLYSIAMSMIYVLTFFLALKIINDRIISVTIQAPGNAF
jgi:O-antigen/teichoic acid export membrane protein